MSQLTLEFYTHRLQSPVKVLSYTSKHYDKPAQHTLPPVGHVRQNEQAEPQSVCDIRGGDYRTHTYVGRATESTECAGLGGKVYIYQGMPLQYSAAVVTAGNGRP